MIPKNRLEALTDGVYAFAMTLLVIDLRLPESFNPKTDGQLLNALSELWSQLLVYAISFWVLGLRWLGQVQIDNPREKVGHGYGAWSLLGLFFVTCVPFSTMLVTGMKCAGSRRRRRSRRRSLGGNRDRGSRSTEGGQVDTYDGLRARVSS